MFDTIYLSPHLDDAALSCGGRITQETAVGKKVLIVTIMAGDPAPGVSSAYADLLHERWELAQNATAARRMEDEAACRVLGAAFKHLPIPDCIYRMNSETGEALYRDWPQIIGVVHPLEQPLIDDLARQFANLPPHQHIVGPLAIGNHVDHQIVRRAAESCFGNELLYYEDYPYSKDEAAFTAVIPLESKDWQAQTISLSNEAVQTKVEAIAAFQSQLSTFFNGRADLEKQIYDHAREIGGERYWLRSTSLPVA